MDIACSFIVCSVHHFVCLYCNELPKRFVLELIITTNFVKAWSFCFFFIQEIPIGFLCRYRRCQVEHTWLHPNLDIVNRVGSQPRSGNRGSNWSDRLVFLLGDFLFSTIIFWIFWIVIEFLEDFFVELRIIFVCCSPACG